MPYKGESAERLNALRREVTKLGIRYASRVSSIPQLERMIGDPYPHQIASYRKRWGIDSLDFREKGITPKPKAYVRWLPKRRDSRMRYRCVGRFVRDNGNGTCVVRYPLWLGNAYKDKLVTIDTFQIVDYREDR